MKTYNVLIAYGNKNVDDKVKLDESDARILVALGNLEEIGAGKKEKDKPASTETAEKQTA